MTYNSQEFTPINFLTICAVMDSHDRSVEIDRVLYEITGDLECAAILSRLRYWFAPGKDGKLRTRIEKNGERWLARSDDAWEEEACVRKKQMPRVKKTLKKLGLVKIEIYKFDNDPTTHWHLNLDVFTHLYNEGIKKMISKYPKREKREKNEVMNNEMKSYEQNLGENEVMNNSYLGLYPNGEKGNTPMGNKEIPHSGISYNISFKHSSYSPDLKHMSPDGENAFSTKRKNERNVVDGYEDFSSLDILGNPLYREKYNLKGKALKLYKSLKNEELEAVQLLRNVPVPSHCSQRFELVTAMKLAQEAGYDAIVHAIKIYQKNLKDGCKIDNFAGYISSLAKKRACSEPQHAEINRERWKNLKKHLPINSFNETKNGIKFTVYPYKELTFSMNEQLFRDELYIATMEICNGS